MFPGNPEFAIAKQYTCGRTKVAAIVQECPRDHRTNFADAMRNGPFLQESGRWGKVLLICSLTTYRVEKLKVEQENLCCVFVCR